MLFSIQNENKIWFIENPRLESVQESRTETSLHGNLTIMTPVLSEDLSVFERKDQMMKVLKDFIIEQKISHYQIFTETCRAVPYLRHLNPEKIHYEESLTEAFTHPELFIEMQEYRD